MKTAQANEDQARVKPSQARKIAFEILLRVERESSFASELLHGPVTSGMSARDAAFCTELVMGSLRWQILLDFFAQRLSRKPWLSFDPEIKVALRVGLYQLKFMQGTPERAAVHETVSLVKLAGKQSATGLVNALLRRAAQMDLTALRISSMSEMEWASIESSHPFWLLDRWANRFGIENTHLLAKKNNQPPKTCLRIHGDKTDRHEFESKLEKIGLTLSLGRYLRDCYVVQKGNIRVALSRFPKYLVVQDEAAQIIPLLLDVRKGQTILDLCAAPGHKSTLLRQAAGDCGIVVAGDLHVHRLRTMEKFHSMDRIIRVALDGTQSLPFTASFDRILIDAPCSGTGTLCRHPEIKLKLTLQDIQQLSEKQYALLDQAATALRQGGRMVYSTCSLEDEENRQVIALFLAEHKDFTLLPLRSDFARLQPHFHPSAAGILDQEYLETFPDRDEMDGFFAAILLKQN